MFRPFAQNAEDFVPQNAFRHDVIFEKYFPPRRRKVGKKGGAPHGSRRKVLRALRTRYAAPRKARKAGEGFFSVSLRRFFPVAAERAEEKTKSRACNGQGDGERHARRLALGEGVLRAHAERRGKRKRPLGEDQGRQKAGHGQKERDARAEKKQGERS